MPDHQNEEKRYYDNLLHANGFTAHIRTEDGAKNFGCGYDSYASEETHCHGSKCPYWHALGSWGGVKIGTCGNDIDVADPSEEQPWGKDE